MGSWSFASRIGRLTFTGTGSGNAQQLASGAAVRVWGFVVAHKGASGTPVVTIQDADGDNTYFSIPMSTRTSFVMDTPFIADRGIRAHVSSNATDVEITFFHSHPGS